MRLTFLGTGTSFGVPQIGCDCAVCRSTDPRDKRTRSGAAVQANGAVVTHSRGIAQPGAHRATDPHAIWKVQKPNPQILQYPLRVVRRAVVEDEDVEIRTARPQLGDDVRQRRGFVVRRNETKNAVWSGA